MSDQSHPQPVSREPLKGVNHFVTCTEPHCCAGRHYSIHASVRIACQTGQANPTVRKQVLVVCPSEPFWSTRVSGETSDYTLILEPARLFANPRWKFSFLPDRHTQRCHSREMQKHSDPQSGRRISAYFARRSRGRTEARSGWKGTSRCFEASSVRDR